MPSLEVPFIQNSGGRCQQACTEMALRYYEPDLLITESFIDDITEYIKGKPTWDTASLIALHRRGYQVLLIDSFHHEQFLDEGASYLTEYYLPLGEEVARYQVLGTDIPKEQQRIEELLSLDNVTILLETAVADDLTDLLYGNWLARLEVNGYPLAGHDGYTGHSVLVTGRKGELTTVHNPDGKFGNKPNQQLDAELLDRAWSMGHYALHAVRL